jgi:TRAP-type transport system periplasmic protein
MKMFFAAALLGLAAAAPVEAQTVKWKLGSAVGPQDPATIDLQKYAAAVKQKSGGKLELDVVPIETVGFKNVDSLRVIKQGVMEAMHLTPYYLFRDAPALAALMPHGALLDPEDNLKIEKVQREIGNEIYRKWDIVPAVDWHAGGLRDLVIVSKEPISSLADLKGKKLRHFTKEGTQAFNELGISTQIVPSSELYLALKTGVVDAAVYGLIYIKSQSINETTCCVSYLAPFTSAFPFTIGVRQDLWAKLDPALQKTMQEVGKEFYAQALDEWRNNKLEEETRAWLKEKGVKFQPDFSLEDRKKVQQALFKAWREQCEKIGPDAVKNYERIIAALGSS